MHRALCLTSMLLMMENTDKKYNQNDVGICKWSETPLSPQCSFWEPHEMTCIIMSVLFFVLREGRGALLLYHLIWWRECDQFFKNKNKTWRCGGNKARYEWIAFQFSVVCVSSRGILLLIAMILTFFSSLGSAVCLKIFATIKTKWYQQSCPLSLRKQWGSIPIQSLFQLDHFHKFTRNVSTKVEATYL